MGRGESSRASVHLGKATCTLSYPEVRAALNAAGRAGRLNSRELALAESLWSQQWSEMSVIQLTPAVASTGGQLAARHALKGSDAVHLASAAALADGNAVFVAWDQRLRAGALAEGLSVAPVLAD
ncbi:MAG: type II toxin-antitoxin system VapC family toxin [Sporichthya sp.]|nr:type II toxin-antitoxin system VapC family toxin [Sporichthya sp.]